MWADTITRDAPAALPEIDLCMRMIQERNLPGGGFAEHPGGSYRPDSTAWAILALAKQNPQSPLIDSARARLRASQSQDGRLSFAGAAGVFWPTSLAVLAWHGPEQYRQAQSRAVAFLLETTGVHRKKDNNSPIAHDTSIKGWPWTEGTHSFVEPTGLALIGLDIVGYSSHPRFQEGLKMLIDRQLPRGGWNYGNTLVYGKELLPFAYTTGMALTALSGHAPREKIDKSILFLKAQLEQCRTPLSLCWALFGLGAWNEFPPEAHAWVCETLKQKEKYGSYSTSLLSLLLLAFACQGEFKKCVQP